MRPYLPRRRAEPLGGVARLATLPQPPAVRAPLHVRRPWRGRSPPGRPGRRAAGPAPAPPAGQGPARTATGRALPLTDRQTRGGGPAPDRRWSWPVLYLP